MTPDFLRQLQDMQRRAEELQKGLAAIEVEGVSGGGLVRATLNGLTELKSISIDPSLLKPEEVKILEDLVVAACTDGRHKVEAKRASDTQFLSDLFKSLRG
ncbi:MAG TPA: YbaB/EbfC family nucleoid-associated protein [Micropepsaceae bacterium]|nr:YbaB/EbfC family nucleoid-associated protein [Micropepsaceae bacterium]